jgi:GNAT superfamily N-acetyltransferase
MEWRETLRAGDEALVEHLCQAAGNFREDEVRVAVELVVERRSRGEASGYEFLFLEEDGRGIGYICYGQIPCTMTSWDVYWIVVDPALQGRGIGRSLLTEAESRMAAAGALRIYIDTSGTEDYRASRAFYERNGYDLAARLPDFHGPFDDKIIYSKPIGASRKNE